MSSGYRTCCVHIIGEAGKSAPTRLPRKGPEHVDWLCEVLDGLEIPSAHVAGLSLGGWLALQTAIHAPQRVRRVVSISNPALERMSLGLVLRGLPLAFFPSRRTIGSFMSYITSPTTPPDPELLDGMLTIVKYMKPNITQPPVTPDALLRRISAPTLVMVGEYEVIGNPQRMVEQARRLIPNVQTEIVADAGHAVTSDQPQRANALILQFLGAH